MAWDKLESWLFGYALSTANDETKYETIDKVILVGYQTYLVIGDEVLDYTTSFNKTARGVNLKYTTTRFGLPTDGSSVAQGKSRMTFAMDLFAVTSEGRICYLSSVDPHFQVTWSVNKQGKYSGGEIKWFTSPAYPTQLTGLNTTGWESLASSNVSYSTTRHCSGVAYTVVDCTLDATIEATKIVVCGKTYTPEVYTRYELYTLLVEHDELNDSLVYMCTLPKEAMKNFDPLDSSCLPEAYSNARIILPEKYTNRHIISSLNDDIMYDGGRTFWLYGMRILYPNMLFYDSNNRGKFTLYFHNPENEYVKVYPNCLGDPSLFKIGSFMPNVTSATATIYTDNAYIHDALVRDYGHLDSTLFSIYRLDGSAWEE